MSHPAAGTIEPRLREIESLAGAMAGLLDAERGALGRRDAPAIEAAAKQKQSLFDDLSRRIESIRDGAAGHGKLSDICREAGLTDLLQRVIDGVQQCHAQNQRNGMVLGAALAVNQELVEVFSGQQPGNTTGTYGATGRLYRRTSSTPISRV